MEQSATSFTYDDYLVVPNHGKRYEIVDGELYTTPAPSTEHQGILATILSFMRDYAKRSDGGKALCAPVDVCCL